MNKKIRFLLLSALILFPALYSCTKTETVSLPEKADDRVYFIYMAADNSLGSFAVRNLSAIEKTVSWQNVGNGRVLVFYDGNGKCEMREYKAGSNKQPMMTVLALYNDLNTASPATFEFAVDEMKKFATAGGRKVDSYILDLWSHGDSWELRPPAPSRGSTRAVVNDGNYWLNLEDFAAVLEPGLFDAVIMAECLGASLEMTYLMRDKTKYVIGSAAEMPADGVQYDRVLKYVFLKNFDYEAYCKSYFDYWESAGAATIAWFDCREFTDEFTDVMTEIYASIEYAQLLDRMNSVSSLSAFEVQCYDRSYTSGPVRKYFDLGDMVNKAFPQGGDLHGRFWEIYNRIMKYLACSELLWETIVDPARFSGMTTYMMLDWNNSYSGLNNNYRETSWYRMAYPN